MRTKTSKGCDRLIFERGCVIQLDGTAVADIALRGITYDLMRWQNEWSADPPPGAQQKYRNTNTEISCFIAAMSAVSDQCHHDPLVCRMVDVSRLFWHLPITALLTILLVLRRFLSICPMEEISIHPPMPRHSPPRTFQGPTHSLVMTLMTTSLRLREKSPPVMMLGPCWESMFDVWPLSTFSGSQHSSRGSFSRVFRSRKRNAGQSPPDEYPFALKVIDKALTSQWDPNALKQGSLPAYHDPFASVDT